MHCALHWSCDSLCTCAVLPSPAAFPTNQGDRAQPAIQSAPLLKAKAGHRVHVSQQSDLSCLFKDQKDIGRLQSGRDKQRG